MRRRNHEGYLDLTAYYALTIVEREEQKIFSEKAPQPPSAKIAKGCRCGA